MAAKTNSKPPETLKTEFRTDQSAHFGSPPILLGPRRPPPLPRTGSPRSLAGSPLMSVQPSFEAQLQLQYADGLALPAALPSGSLLHMPCVPPQAAVETCTLAMMVQPPEDPLEPTGKPPWSDWG